jgi:hypothetical protein
MTLGTNYVNEFIAIAPMEPAGYESLSESYRRKCRYFVKRLKKKLPHFIEENFSSLTELETFVKEIDSNGFYMHMSGDFTSKGRSFKGHINRLKSIHHFLSPQEVETGTFQIRVDLTNDSQKTFTGELAKYFSALNLIGIYTVDELKSVLSKHDQELVHRISKLFSKQDQYYQFLRIVCLLILLKTKCDSGVIRQIKDDCEVDEELAIPHLDEFVNEALTSSIKEMQYV